MVTAQNLVKQKEMRAIAKWLGDELTKNRIPFSEHDTEFKN